MATLSDDDVRHIGKLCRLNLTEAQVQKIGPELNSIITYIEKLQEVDTSNVEATPQSTGIVNRFREDVVVSDGPSREELLATSPLPIVDNQIQTPSAHG